MLISLNGWEDAGIGGLIVAILAAIVEWLRLKGKQTTTK